MESNNLELLNEYLASRHQDPKFRELEEFSCPDCLTNLALDQLAQYEAQRTRAFNFIPKKVRRIMAVGLTFTRESVMYWAHMSQKDCENHQWFKSQPEVQVPIQTY